MLKPCLKFEAPEVADLLSRKLWKLVNQYYRIGYIGHPYLPDLLDSKSPSYHNPQHIFINDARVGLYDKSKNLIQFYDLDGQEKDRIDLSRCFWGHCQFLCFTHDGYLVSSPEEYFIYRSLYHREAEYHCPGAIKKMTKGATTMNLSCSRPGLCYRDDEHNLHVLDNKLVRELKIPLPDIRIRSAALTSNRIFLAHRHCLYALDRKTGDLLRTRELEIPNLRLKKSRRSYYFMKAKRLISFSPIKLTEIRLFTDEKQLYVSRSSNRGHWIEFYSHDLEIISCIELDGPLIAVDQGYLYTQRRDKSPDSPSYGISEWYLEDDEIRRYYFRKQ
jgi:hypothetical protein